MRLNLERQFSGPWVALQRFALRRLVSSYEPYQPVTLGKQSLAKGDRACTDRWLVIAHVLQQTGSHSMLDLGCAEGFFVQEAARQDGCIAIGVDADRRRLNVARSTASLNEVHRAGFIYAMVDADLLACLPSFDVVLFLSVLHHVMYEHGVDYAAALMRAIHDRTNKCLIFDMGQSDETKHEWSNLLPKMTPSPKEWIAAFLRDCGYTTVTPIAETDAYKSQVRRQLFTAYP